MYLFEDFDCRVGGKVLKTLQSQISALRNLQSQKLTEPV